MRSLVIALILIAGHPSNLSRLIRGWPIRAWRK
jgi:hypothetical protein